MSDEKPVIAETLYVSAAPTVLGWPGNVSMIEPTVLLRWNDGVLEQAWRDHYSSEIEWKPVSQKGDE